MKMSVGSSVSHQCFDTVGLKQEGHLASKKLDVGLLVVTI